MTNTIPTGETFLEQCKRRRAELGSKRCQLPQRRYDFTLPDLPPEWCWASLSEVCERVSVGHVGPTSQYFTDDKAGIPLVRSQDVRPGLFRLSNTLRITAEFHRKLKSTLKSGDILFVRVGANRGDCCVVPPGSPEMNCANVVFARPLFPNGFFGLYFRTEFAQKLLLSATTGAAQGVINTESIARMPVPVPPPAVQEKLASILSAYDDLIENNSRRIKILEDMAKMVHQEWFVNFRFPGHEKVKIVESEMGPIPQGWQVARVEDFGDVITGKTPSKQRAEFFGTEIPFIKLPDMHGKIFVLDTAEHLSVLGQENQATKTIPPGTLCVSCIGTAGIVIITTRPSQTNQQINSVVLRSVNDREFLYFRFLDLRETINQYGANGVTMVNLNKTKFENLRVIRPERVLVERFHSLVCPIFEQIRNRQQCISNLSQTRDLLLPKLLSGEVSVEQFEVEAVPQGV